MDYRGKKYIYVKGIDSHCTGCAFNDVRIDHDYCSIDKAGDWDQDTMDCTEYIYKESLSTILKKL